MSQLDPEAVHAFLLVAELKSFTRAARILNITQSAVSLKVSRLEKRLGRRLVERTPRLVRLSPAGEAFLPIARTFTDAYLAAVAAFDERPGRLVVGISHHIVGSDLPSILRSVRGVDGLITDLRTGPTRNLLDSYDAGEMDAVLLIGHDESRRGGENVITEEFQWMAAPDLVLLPGAPLPLILQGEPCKLRAMTVASLAAAGIPWREVFLGAGLSSVAAAAIGGLGVAVVSRRAAPDGLLDVSKQLGLPKLPSKPIVLHSNTSDPRAKVLLGALVAGFRASSDAVEARGLAAA
jgi:DNA-binding transcriptional LysR family regulator